MLLHSLHLQNFRQHAETTITFSRGLTGIIGTNGGGKSTVLEGIAFALYGVPAARGTKDSIKWRRAQPRAQVKVELVFTLAGHRYRVVRGLSSAELFLDGAETPLANSLSGVTEQLQRVLGMTRAEFFTTYFTGQKELAVMASLGATERAKFLSRVLGYDKIGDAQELVRERKRALLAECNGLRLAMPDADAIAANVRLYTTELAHAAARIAEATTARDTAADDLTRLTPRWTQAQASRERDRELASARALLEEQLAAADRDAGRLATELAAIGVAIAERDAITPSLDGLPALRTELATLDRIAQADTARQHAIGALTALTQQLERATQEVADLAYDDAERVSAEAAVGGAMLAGNTASAAAREAREAWQADVAAAKHAVHQLRELYTIASKQRDELLAKGADGACVACGQPLGASWQTAVDRADAELATLKQRGLEAKASFDALAMAPASVSEAAAADSEAVMALSAANAAMLTARERDARARQLQAERQALTLKQAALTSSMAGTLEPYDASAHTALRDTVARLTAVESRVAVLHAQSARHAAAASEHLAVTLRAIDVRTRLSQVHAEQAAIGFSAERFEAARSEFVEAGNRAQAAATLVLTAENARDRASDALRLAEQQLQDTAAAREKLVMLERERLQTEDLDRAYADLRTDLNAKLRPELAEIASGLLDVLTDGRYSHAEFDENYTLTVVEDGLPKPVISGGEEDLCNLILRLAISQMIAARAGHAFSLLILDEVFGALDENRRGNVMEMLRGLGDRFEQVIVITHIGQVRDGLDHIVQVQYDAESGSSVVVIEEPGSMAAMIDAVELAEVAA